MKAQRSTVTPRWIQRKKHSLMAAGEGRPCATGRGGTNRSTRSPAPVGEMKVESNWCNDPRRRYYLDDPADWLDHVKASLRVRRLTRNTCGAECGGGETTQLLIHITLARCCVDKWLGVSGIAATSITHHFEGNSDTRQSIGIVLYRHECSR